MAKLPYLISRGASGGTLMIDQVPESIYINANKVVAIYSAKILSSEDRKAMGVEPGGADVLLKSATGGQQLITRDALAKNYVHPNGKKIKIAFLNANTGYLVVKTCNEKYKALKLPGNCSGRLRGKDVKPNSYVVCPVDQNGNAVLNRTYVISEKLFKKMFKVPLQNVIKNNMKEKRSPLFDFVAWDNRGRPKQDMSKPIYNFKQATNNGFKETKSNSKIDFTKRPQTGFGAFSANMVKPQQVVKPQQTESKYRFKAVARLIRTNGTSTKTLVGFTVIDLTNNNKKNISVDQTKQLCERHLVENLMTVIKEGTEVRFLRGNGIRIESLPEILV